MSVLLGIDTGGTYTDAVLFSPERGVVASAKALTRRHDLALGIGEALERVLASGGARGGPSVELVSLSTTLATNAVVEGQGNSICLILIGYPAEALQQSRLGEVMGPDPVVFVRGGHDATGEQVAPLDLAKAREAVERFSSGVSAFAVSGYFSVRNPSHENAVRALIREHSGLPVTCGHELTTNLHASRRALTAALNARLVPVLSDLVHAVQGMLAAHRIAAPLMVVKGDGSLVDASFALEYPIETILSGPAASVVGSLHLSGKREACVVDMGGTTTDIALVTGGKPILNRDGATIGGWQTMVEAVQIHTSGLGGDSEVRLEDGGRIVLGPRRLIPLSLLASEHPETVDELKRQGKRAVPGELSGRFAMLARSWKGAEGRMSESQRIILSRLDSTRPVPLSRLFLGAESPFLMETELDRLVTGGYIGLGGFTPTDAAHVLGLQGSWSVEAARLGAELWARACRGNGGRAGGEPAGAGGARVGAAAGGPAESSEALCRRVFRQVVLHSGRAVVEAVLAEAHGLELDSLPSLRALFIDRPLERRVLKRRGASPPAGHPPAAAGQDSERRRRAEEPPARPGQRVRSLDPVLDIQVSLKHPLVAIGAPVAIYYPEVAAALDAELCVPQHAEVANAVGAVVGSVMQRVRILITPQEGGELYRVHFEEGVQNFAELEQAIAFAEQAAEARARELARKAGAVSVTVSVDREDRSAQVAGDALFVQSMVTATAIGRPHVA